MWSGFEFLVSTIADGDHQSGHSLHGVELLRSFVTHLQSAPLRCGDRSRVYALRRVGPGRQSRLPGDLLPEGGRELGPG
jgi:hypothetical protein